MQTDQAGSDSVYSILCNSTNKTFNCLYPKCPDISSCQHTACESLPCSVKSLQTEVNNDDSNHLGGEEACPIGLNEKSGHRLGVQPKSSNFK